MRRFATGAFGIMTETVMPRAGAAMENAVSGGEVEGVGAVGEVGDGEADTVVTEEGGEPDQGVGESVRLADAVAEELVLAGARFAGGEGELDTLDGSGKLERFEPGLQGREEDFGAGRGFGEFDADLFQAFV